jgi:hypothetical protein
VLLHCKVTKVLLGVGMLHGCAGVFPGKEGGIEVLAGLAPSSQSVGSGSAITNGREPTSCLG